MLEILINTILYFAITGISFDLVRYPVFLSMYLWFIAPGSKLLDIFLTTWLKYCLTQNAKKPSNIFKARILLDVLV